MTPDDYQQASRELARSAAMPEDVAARMERDLAQTFAAETVGTPARFGRAGSSAFAKAPADRRRFSGGRLDAARVLAAAATVIIAIGAGLWYVRQRTITPKDVTPSAQVRLKADATDPGRSVGIQAADPAPPRAKTARPRARKLPPVVQPAGFVPVPAAAGLPQFESGVIVRLSLPVAALPSYGVDISPASSGDSVEADVLIAQDGVPRAIRLVNTSRSQQ